MKIVATMMWNTDVRTVRPAGAVRASETRRRIAVQQMQAAFFIAQFLCRIADA